MIDNKVGNYRQMIRRGECEPAAMDRDLFECYQRVVIDVIEMQDRKHSRVRARPAETLFGFGAVQVIAHKMSRETSGPLVEIAEHDSRC